MTGCGPKYPFMHRHSEASVHPVPSLLVHPVVVAPVGHAVHVAGPIADLYVATAQLVHVSEGFEIVPVAPATQVQSVRAFVAVDSVLERCGQLIQLAEPAVAAYVPWTHCVHVLMGLVRVP